MAKYNQLTSLPFKGLKQLTLVKRELNYALRFIPECCWISQFHRSFFLSITCLSFFLIRSAGTSPHLCYRAVNALLCRNTAPAASACCMRYKL